MFLRKVKVVIFMMLMVINIDYLLALLPIILGYRDVDVDRAVKRQINKRIFPCLIQ